MKNNISRKEFLRLTALTSLGVAAPQIVFSEETKTTDRDPFFVQASDASYEALRKGFNKRINKFPKTIALCHSTEEVATAVRYARDNHLNIAIRSGGHSMEGFSSNDGGLVIDLRNLNSVEILDGGIIKAGPGCILSKLYDTILPAGRLIPTGSCGTVGLGGLTTGGGYGLFSRKYGLTCDHLVRATFVDGFGKIHSTDDDAELLWALKGGGSGNFGIVTELFYQSVPAPETMQSHHLRAKKLDVTRAVDLMKKWFSFAEKLPDSCFSAFVLNGSTLNLLITNFEKHTPELQALLASLATSFDEFHSSEYRPLASKLKAYYGSLVPVTFKNSSAGFYQSFQDIEPIATEVVEKIISNSGLIFQVNTLGGKVNDKAFSEKSCFAHRNHLFISELQAYWDLPQQEKKLTSASTEILKLFAAHGLNKQYINYCSLDFENWETAYYGKNYSRLQKIKQKYDPENIIRHPQSIKA